MHHSDLKDSQIDSQWSINLLFGVRFDLNLKHLTKTANFKMTHFVVKCKENRLISGLTNW